MVVMLIVQKMTKITTAGDKNLAIPIQTYIRSRLSRDSCSNSSLREWTVIKLMGIVTMKMRMEYDEG